MSHGTPHREWFHEHTPLTEFHAMFMGDGRIQQVVGVGTIIIHLYSSHEINVQNVFYIFEINKSLLSIGKIATSRMQMLIKYDTCWISTKKS